MLPPPTAATPLDAVLVGATGCTIAGTAGDDVLVRVEHSVAHASVAAYPGPARACHLSTVLGSMP